MAIDQISSMSAGSLSAPLKEIGAAQPEATNFSELVTNGINKVHETMLQSAQMSREFMQEGKHDMHEVLIALEQADLSFKFMSQIRNKVLDVYNEVMRMQV